MSNWNAGPAVTRDEALELAVHEFHHNTLTLASGACQIWRRNGRVKLWKRSPDRFQVPLKTGYYGPYGYLTEDTVGEFHTPDQCPRHRIAVTMHDLSGSWPSEARITRALKLVQRRT